MEKRDLVLRMIQQTAQLLRAVFNSLPIDDFETEQQVQDFTSSLKENLHLDLDKFILLTDEEVLTYLLTIEGMDIENIESLADILRLLALKTQDSLNEKSALLNSKALLLFQYVSDTSKTYDWGRENKIITLKSRLT
ncbi:hypothetical protein HX045_04310 [Myroides odoratimimus]|uniref:Uncharacterized protein n=3 Tax=Myroides odoratimimus TaxID=76832 RepID=A0A0S7ECL2_9FLAO|nr:MULTISPECIES: hypothetical protein [Myroides]AJA68726.1 hypothetical protein MYRA21_1573 [Myroides sp. A21]ALU25988.1 hypothetical protein AS202_07455 [Myroides odoratimimus]APA92034.1 hypothetical protein BK054_07330 [Myroides sp. ZB35]EHO11119.1 hypothetical protein HMPREF9712_00776 [Myroides odoratimimus CCUG 10230]EHO14240.1 hypothetical protein HMPREF9714_00502 [Myroides odoratimimus CCUG 12901]